MLNFVDPKTKGKLDIDSEGNLLIDSNNKRTKYLNYNGTYDFTKSSFSNSEKQYYDDHYTSSASFLLTEKNVQDPWIDLTNPWCTSLLQSLGNLDKKRILLVGNGKSFKEFLFLAKGASIVYSDLSINAVRYMRQLYDISKLEIAFGCDIEFHAIDALFLPFPENYFDIIYGYAFVHHIDDLDKFFSEIYRCLKKGGICRFFDQADSPLWDTLRDTLFLPLKKYSYRKSPRSPQDINSQKRKVFNYAHLKIIQDRFGFSGIYFKREWFLLWLVVRHYGKFVNWDKGSMRKARSFFLFMKKLDKIISNYTFIKNNQLTLVWGYEK